MKFGGTSVGDVAAFERVFHIVSTQIERRPVVVVSAMTKVTDALLAAFETAKKGEFAEAFAPGDNRLDSDEVDEVIGGVRESGIADADKAARAAVTTGEAGGVQGELESAPDAPKGSVGVQPGANPRVICG